jgi:hypothetical protein
VRSFGSASFLLFRGGGQSSLLEGGDGMSSGAGEVLADDRREEEAEMYVLANDRLNSGGGLGDRERTDRSESDASEEGTGLSGELGPPLSGVQ